MKQLCDKQRNRLIVLYLDPFGDGGGPGPPGQQRVVQEEAGVLEAGANPGICAGNAAGSAS